jgi:hypothetical protein
MNTLHRKVVWTVWIDFDECILLLSLGKVEILQEKLAQFGGSTNQNLNPRK